MVSIYQDKHNEWVSSEDLEHDSLSELFVLYGAVAAKLHNSTINRFDNSSLIHSHFKLLYCNKLFKKSTFYI